MIPGETVGDAFLILTPVSAVYLWLAAAHRYRKQMADEMSSLKKSAGDALALAESFRSEFPAHRDWVGSQIESLRGSLRSELAGGVGKDLSDLRKIVGSHGDSISNNTAAIEGLRGPLQITEKGAAKRIDVYFNHKSLTEVNYAIAILVGEVNDSVDDLRRELKGPEKTESVTDNRDPRYQNIRDLSDAVERLEERGRGLMDQMFNRQKP